VLVWPREIPFDGSPVDTAERVNAYASWLPTSTVPKLMLYGEPGGIINGATALEMAQSWQQLDAEFMGDGLHFIQEDQGPGIGERVVKWMHSAESSPRLERADP
jgi:haloalkane dehalogenase